MLAPSKIIGGLPPLPTPMYSYFCSHINILPPRKKTTKFTSAKFQNCLFHAIICILRTAKNRVQKFTSVKFKNNFFLVVIYEEVPKHRRQNLYLQSFKTISSML